MPRCTAEARASARSSLYRLLALAFSYPLAERRAALALGVIGGMLQIVSVASQALTLGAIRAPAAIDTGEPWAAVWDRAPRQEVPLSAQNVAPPFGGGAASTLVARQEDGRRFIANTPSDRGLLEAFVAEQQVGRGGTLSHRDGANACAPSWGVRGGVAAPGRGPARVRGGGPRSLTVPLC